MANAGAQALDETMRRLAAFPDAPLKIERRESSLVLTPTEPGSFAISLYDQGDETMIAAERWHTHYEDPLDAAFCALWLLTPYYRIVHELKGGSLAAVWIERYEPEGWVGFEPVYFLNPEHAPSWESERGESLVRRTIQQAILPPPAPYELVVPGVELDEFGMPPGCRIGAHHEEVDHLIAPSLFDPELDED